MSGWTKTGAAIKPRPPVDPREPRLTSKADAIRRVLQSELTQPIDVKVGISGTLSPESDVRFVSRLTDAFNGHVTLSDLERDSVESLAWTLLTSAGWRPPFGVAAYGDKDTYPDRVQNELRTRGDRPGYGTSWLMEDGKLVILLRDRDGCVVARQTVGDGNTGVRVEPHIVARSLAAEVALYEAQRKATAEEFYPPSPSPGSRCPKLVHVQQISYEERLGHFERCWAEMNEELIPVECTSETGEPASFLGDIPGVGISARPTLTVGWDPYDE